MRKIRDVLRLHAGQLSKRRIAVSLDLGRTAVRDYIKRATRAGLGWPLPEGLSDEALERLPAGARLAGPAPGAQETRGDARALVGGIPRGPSRRLRPQSVL
jgi:hypothetical protein